MEAINTWDDAEFHFVETLDAGTDMVAANQSATLRGKTSGAEVLWSYWVLFRFRGGKIVESKWLTSRDEALQTARDWEGLTNT
jgi:hypothetical protein